MTPRGIACGLAVAAGVANGLSWLPISLAPVLAPVFAALFLAALRRVETGRDAIWVGVCFGATRYVVAGHFIVGLTQYSPLALILFALYVAYIVPFAILESWGALRLERRTGMSRAFWAGALFTLLEWVRTRSDLSFPADMVAHDFAPHPSWLVSTPLLGPHVIPVLIFATGFLLERAWHRRAHRLNALRLAAVGLALWIASPLCSHLARSEPDEMMPSLRVALVQPAVDPRVKMDRSQDASNWTRLETMTLEAAGRADLIIWPESSRPGVIVWKSSEAFGDDRVEALARKAGTPILYGAQIARVSGSRVNLYNGASLVHPDGRAAQWYGKQRLLPLAEGVPFGSLLGLDPSQRATPSGDESYLRLFGLFTPGPEPTIFRVGDARIGVLICYETSYPVLARRYAQRGANVLAVLTDDAWWGKTLFPPWHATMVATRARESSLPIVRAANTGVSSYTTATGSVLARTVLGESTISFVDVPLAPPRTTFYARFGDLLIFALWLALLAGVLLGQRLTPAEP